MFLHNFLIFSLISGYYCNEEAPVVETPLGSIRGYFSTSYEGKKFQAFEGIPFGKPPVGERRFEEPESVDPWEGVLNATSATMCAQALQQLPFITYGTEDCLHVNVYVPREEINPEEKLEVIVHIHGGAFMSGSGASYAKPLYVIDKDVVFVTFNYRLGILGFLSTEDEVVPGNNGLKDQVLALKWIKDNIESFGGNPDSITLTGMSAGSTSLHLHYFSELSNGLFHRGFGQSGGAFGPSAIIEGNLEKAKQLADYLDCPSDTTRSLINCLKEVPCESILQSISQFQVYKNIPIHPFGVVVEKKGSNPFLTEDPYVLLSKGQVLDVPYLVSNVLDEGLLFVESYNDEDISYFDEHWDEIAPLLFDFNYTLPKESWKNASEAIREHYFGDKAITSQALTEAFSDRYFLYAADLAIKMHANVSTSPVYYYIFGYTGDKTTVGHSAEIKYMFGNTISPIPLTENELKMKDLLWNMVISYAKTDKPTFGSVNWEPTTYEEDIYVEVDGIETEDIKSLTAKELADREFWKSLNFAENDNLV